MNASTRSSQTDNPAVDAEVLRETLAALWAAWWHTRLWQRRTDVGALLPPVSPTTKLELAAVERIVQRVDQIVRVLFFWKFNKRCYYRSFAAAWVLRLRGLPVRLDFGLRLSDNRRKRCHCWITLDDHPLGEEGDPRKKFPIPAGRWRQDVSYWLAENKPE